MLKNANALACLKFSEIIKEDSLHYLAHELRGQSYLIRGLYQNAVVDFYFCIKKEPDSLMNYINR